MTQDTHTASGTAIDRALDAFERRERGIPQARIAAELVAELRAALASAAAPAQQPGAAYAELPDALEALQLKSCPCGATPTALQITGDEQAKWAHVSGNCCGEWEIEYRNNYTKLASTEAMTLAAAAWNEAPRASHGQAPAQAAPAAVAGSSDDLVTRESAMQAIEHLAISNSPGLEDDAIAMLAAAPTTQPVSQQEAQEPHGWLYEWTHSSATGRPDATYTAFTTDEAHARKHDNCRAIYTSPQPSPAAQGDALDAARYRFLRDGEWRDTDLEPFIRLQLNTLWDAKIDAARAAQEGKSHDNT